MLLVSLVLLLATAACSSSPPGSSDGGLGGRDGGDTGDAGDGGGDGGDGDDGGDPFAGLDPIDPECADGQGPAEKCWNEWLKRVGDVKFTPVQRGELGAGPWPTTELVTMGGGEGLSGEIMGVGVDTGQNVYVVSRDALHIRRVGQSRFSRHARNTDGLRDFPMLSVAGGAPGVAYVGYQGIHGPDPDQDPPEMRRTGDAQQINLTSSGFDAITWRTHNSNTPVSGKYDHSRTIHEIVVPRRGKAAGEVFLGTEHGVVRYQGEYYVDHVHIDTMVGGSQRFGDTKALTVTDDGVMWYGNFWRFGGRPWHPRLREWYETHWIYPSHAYGGAEDRNFHEGIGVDSKGHVWVAARTHGLAHLEIAPNGRSAKLHRLGAPSTDFTDLVVDTNDTLWVASDAGLHRYDPSSRSWTRLSGVSGSVRDLFLDDTVTPRALYIATRSNVYVYRGP